MKKEVNNDEILKWMSNKILDGLHTLDYMNSISGILATSNSTFVCPANGIIRYTVRATTTVSWYGFIITDKDKKYSCSKAVDLAKVNDYDSQDFYVNKGDSIVATYSNISPSQSRVLFIPWKVQ